MYAVYFLTAMMAADPLQFKEPTFDAGEVRMGPPLARRFEFQNSGAAILSVTGIRSSCGCMTPKLAKRVYQPGERGDVIVEVNTLSQPIGPHRWAFHLSYQCGDSVGEATIELAATLKQEIEITPAALAFRGDGPFSATVTIRDPRQSPKILSVLPSAVTTSASYLTIQDQIKPCSFDVRVTTDCPEGRHAETITIRTDDPDYPMIKIPVTIIREPKARVSVSPARATLVAGGSAIVQLRAVVGTAVRVDAIETGAAALSCRWAAGPGDRATVRVSLDRTKWDGQPFTSEVQIRLSAPAGELIVIPVAVRAAD